MKLLTIVGARPQFIKAAALSRAITARPHISEVLVHTGQHYDVEMSDIFFGELDIPVPSYNLGIGGGTHGQMTGRQLEAMERVLTVEAPDVVVVFGDTNSTLAGALAAAKMHIPVAHVEAGLRSFNRAMPEELNRILTDHASDFLFAPTDAAVSNLRREGIPEQCVHLVGDVMYDAALHYRPMAREPQWFSNLELSSDHFCLATIHREQTVNSIERLNAIMGGFAQSGQPFIMPLHPRTRLRITQFGIAIPSHVNIVPPVGYLEMLWLESHCDRVVTDSGGVQKEAFFHGKFCVTLREETEWPELVEGGWNVLVGTDSERIAEALTRDPLPPTSISIYGGGQATQNIMRTIECIK